MKPKPMFRQGDVLIVQTVAIPMDAKPTKRDAGRVILAYGEVTGHAHAIVEPEVVKLSAGIEEYLQVAEASEVRHEEHATIPVPAGDYRIIHQREYTPERVVPVRD
ncbi:MAG: hypothetical protein JWN14_3294 [Chthonomonadales bacterium]|nr:hypothetical protein [Chthonomonadales bacterium]